MRPRAFLIGTGLVLLAIALVRNTRRSENDPIMPAPTGRMVGSAGPDAARTPPRPTRRAGDTLVAPADAGRRPSTTSPTNWLTLLLSDNEASTRLPRATIDRWVASGHTNAEELLAARQAGGGIEFLRMALTNFPNDPRVLLAATALDDGPEATRERLDRFKAAAPDNAVADYLSARDNLRKGRPNQAIADLQAAGGKGQFQDYVTDSIQNAEEIFLDSGKSPAEAKALAATTALLPYLAQFKGLAQDLAALQKQYIAAGDPGSAAQLASLGYQLGQQLESGGGAKTLISQLVGIAIDRIVLGPLDPNRQYDFLPGTVADQLADLTARREAVRTVSKDIGQFMAGATEAEIVSYFDRWKLYGEFGAMKWLRQRQANARPP